MSRRLVVEVMACALLLWGCGDNGGSESTEGSTTSTTATTRRAEPPATTTTRRAPGVLVAQAKVPSVGVRDLPDGPITRTLANPTETGGPLVFLVDQQSEESVKVHLPVRPNGSTGWVQLAEVELRRNPYRIRVELAAHRITVTKADAIVLQEPVGVGTQDTPTPGGVFYVKELLRPPNPYGPYGPYAFGLSGFSNQLLQFAGGDGVIGIHGTNDPSSIGRDVSHGCIRMRNEAITSLVGMLPLGTPVEISP